MESIQLENPKGVEDKPAENLISSSSSFMDVIFGEPQILSRVGDQYQAEIPALAAQYDNFEPEEKPNHPKFTNDFPKCFVFGVELPVSKTFNANTSNIEVELNDGKKRSLPGSWSKLEHNSFLLGLYIYGKNLLHVKRFMGSKSMGDILTFYYGKFYRSDEHRRWSECRKIRSRRCIHGQKIFTGWRLQELLSRLFSQVSEERQTVLLEVSRSFAEGKISLEEYVSTLKDKVGIAMLIEAVGIGNGKKDLTGIVTEPIKRNRVFSLRPEIPIGKACSSLTTKDVIKFLTGDFRLSKARSNDLFWEAVWPRLLARGWHSEQPDSSKHSLVFLIPSVKKFSKSTLVKGNHYFDSVTDVLSKVASEPGLLDLEKHEELFIAVEEDIEYRSSTQKVISSRPNYLSPPTKRPRLSNARENTDTEKGSSRNLPSACELIDLNLPPAPLDLEHSDSWANEPTVLSEPSHQMDPTMNDRRHSTRNRPLTTRALEAFACGFFNTKRMRKGGDNSSSRTSRRVRGRVDDIAGPTIEKKAVDVNPNPSFMI